MGGACVTASPAYTYSIALANTQRDVQDMRKRAPGAPPRDHSERVPPMAALIVEKKKGYMPRPTYNEKWLRAILQMMTLDYVSNHCQKWKADDVRRLKRAIDTAKIRCEPFSKTESCDAWTEFEGARIEFVFAERPSCSWFQLIAHELAHVIDFVHSGEGVAHAPAFFRYYRRLLNQWLRATETGTFVVLEKVGCRDPEAEALAPEAGAADD